MAPPRDLGLQPERTGLAWWRTALSILAVDLLSLRAALTVGSLWSLGASLVGAATAFGMVFIGMLRPDFRPDREDVANRRSRRSLAGLACTVGAIAILEGIGLLVRHAL